MKVLVSYFYSRGISFTFGHLDMTVKGKLNTAAIPLIMKELERVNGQPSTIINIIKLEA